MLSIALVIVKKKTPIITNKTKIDVFVFFFFYLHRFLVVLCCLVVGVICTIGEYEEKITQKFIYVVNWLVERNDSNVMVIFVCLLFKETCLLIFFASEYIIRVWSAGCRAKFKGYMGRLRFMRTPISLIDLFVVLASSIVIGFHISGRIDTANPG